MQMEYWFVYFKHYHVLSLFLSLLICSQQHRREHCHLIGHQPDPTFLRKLQKTNSVPLQTRGEPLNHTVPGRVASPSPGVGGPQIHDRTMVRPPPGFQTVSLDQEVACATDDSRSIDEICDENIQLFMRYKLLF